MIPRPNAARIGLFAIGGLTLLVAAVALLFGSRWLSPTEPAVMHFKGSIYGLQLGSPVVFRGVRLGSVKSMALAQEKGQLAVPVEIELESQRLEALLGGNARGREALALLVIKGLSAQLATHSLLTGQLYVDLDLRPALAPEAVAAEGLIEIPTTLTRFQSLQDQLDRFDLGRMSEDLTAMLAAARATLTGPELKKTLGELSQASASLSRLLATLDRRAPALTDAAQGTLAQAGKASDRVGSAADRVTGAADRISAAAELAESALQPGSPLMASVQKAADELARSAAALRSATSDDSASVQSVQRAMGDVSRAARSVRELADLIEQQPQSLIRGRNPPAAP